MSNVILMGENQHTESRNYTKVDWTVYSLPHDGQERDRLALQDKLLLRTYGNKALQAPIDLKDNDWVLDMGCGSGIWLQDLAQQTHARPQYIGIDIEPALFPNPLTLPPNMRFEIHSVTHLPAQWTNKFTVVHQRLLMAGLRGHEWEQAIDEMFRVLQPGGWVQLLEMKMWTAGPALAKQLELNCRDSDARGTMWRDITQRIPGFLCRSGFVNVSEDVQRTPLGVWAGKDGIDGKSNILGVMRGLKTSVLKGGGYGIVETEAEYDELVEQVMWELDSTPGAGTDWSLFCAQKPLVPPANYSGGQLYV